MAKKVIITIARQYGSGGREIGERVAIKGERVEVCTVTHCEAARSIVSITRFVLCETVLSDLN